MPYKEVALYTDCRGLQGQQGILGSSRSILWIPLSQSLFRRLTCAALQHILTLSLEFHLSTRIGEVLSALSKGSVLNTFLDSFAFQLFRWCSIWSFGRLLPYLSRPFLLTSGYSSDVVLYLHDDIYGNMAGKSKKGHGNEKP